MSIDYEKYGPTIGVDGSLLRRPATFCDQPAPQHLTNREEMAEVLEFDNLKTRASSIDELIERLCAVQRTPAAPRWMRAAAAIE